MTQVLNNYSEELQKKFLLFTTGSDRVPVGGMGEMTFKITRVNNKINNLPEAHTCFNQVPGLKSLSGKKFTCHKRSLNLSVLVGRDITADSRDSPFEMARCNVKQRYIEDVDVDVDVVVDD